MKKNEVIFRNNKFISFGTLITCIIFLFSYDSFQSKADIIFINGKIVTVNNDFLIASALAIKGSKILAVGLDNDIQELAGKQTQIINLHGKTVIPGIIDSHVHPEKASISEIYNEIPNPNSISQLLHWIEHQASLKKKGEWIIHPKLFYTRLIDLRPPTLHELDSVAPYNPVFLNGSYGGLINSMAMEVSGLTEDKIEKDPKTGALSSLIKSSVFDFLQLPKEKVVTTKARKEALKKLFSNYNEYGITGVISGYNNLNNYDRYRDLSKKDALTIRVTQNFILPKTFKGNGKNLMGYLRGLNKKIGDGNVWVQKGSLKIFMDGGILTGTAYLRKPWGERASVVYGARGDVYRGQLNYNYKNLLNIASTTLENGWGLTAHCTGGGSVDLFLDVLEEVNRIQLIKDKRVSIIHGNFFTREANDRMKKLGVIAIVQPAWFYKDAVAMKYILGEDRIKTFNPYKSMIESGVKLCGGSDHMVKMDANSSINPYNPFLAMWSMITRNTEQNIIITPNEAISREEALRIYTINNAFATFRDSITGSLEVGKLADLVVLSKDFLTCPINQIKEIKSELTIVGGKVVYRQDL